MNRAEFMRRLTELLNDVPPAEREEAIQYYNDYFDDAGAENESGVIASLGTPEELARTIKAGLSDGGNTGEFTESGFSGYTQIHKDEVVRVSEPGMGGQSESGRTYSGSNGAGNGSAQTGGNQNQTDNSYYQNAYYQRTDGKGIYGGREDTRKQNNPYEQPGSGSYGQTGGGYGYGYTTDPQQSQQSTAKQGMSGGMIALTVIVAVLTFPLWVGLLGALFGIVVGLFAAMFGIFIAFLAAGVGLLIVSIALLITGIVLMFSEPLAGLCLIGSAFVVFAIGLVFLWLMVLIVGMAIPALVRGISALGRKLFHRGGARA